MKTNKGITLIDLLIIMSLTAVLLPIIIGIYMSITKIYATEDTRSKLRTDMARAMNRLTEELRKAKSITINGDKMLGFWVDENGNKIRETSETIIYSWYGVSSEALYRTVNSVMEKIIPTVTKFTITYDSTKLANIRMIDIQLTAKYKDATYSLSTKVRPRNIP